MSNILERLKAPILEYVHYETIRIEAANVIEQLELENEDLQEENRRLMGQVDLNKEFIERFKYQTERLQYSEKKSVAEIDRLRKILAKVPTKVYFKAKEEAGYGEKIYPQTFLSEGEWKLWGEIQNSLDAEPW